MEIGAIEISRYISSGGGRRQRRAVDYSIGARAGAVVRGGGERRRVLGIGGDTPVLYHVWRCRAVVYNKSRRLVRTAPATIRPRYIERRVCARAAARSAATKAVM